MGQPTEANNALRLLGEAARKLSEAFASARLAGCDTASQIICRAAVINASAIEQLINPADSTGGQSTKTQRAFVAERTVERARQCSCGHTAEQHDHLGYSKRGACNCSQQCGCFSFSVAA